MEAKTQEQIDYERATERIELAECLENLQNNKDFQKLITDNYLSAYANRLVMLKAVATMQNEENQTAIESSLRGISEFNQFILYVRQEGEIAKKMIEDYHTAEIEEIN